MGLFHHSVNFDDKTLTIEQRYGKAFLELINPTTRKNGYEKLEKIENDFPEASIPLGQYYSGKKSINHFERAAKAGLPEGHFCICRMMGNSDKTNMNSLRNRTWFLHMFKAAQGECTEACHELAHFYFIRKYYIESLYWYYMAKCLGHNQAENGIKYSLDMILHDDTIKGEDAYYFSTDQMQTATILLKELLSCGETDVKTKLALLAQGNERLAKYVLGSYYERNNNWEEAYLTYLSMTYDNAYHGLRRCADILSLGQYSIDQKKDEEIAMAYYKNAAEHGNVPSMFAMGEYYYKKQDRYSAACYYGQAYIRGLEKAGVRLKELTTISIR